MAKSLSAILAAGMVVFVIAMAAFGGLSYGFFEYGASWRGLGFIVGLFTVFGFSIYALRGFLGRYSGRLMFALWIIAILGSYFTFLMRQDAYPMGIDLAGGTELIYGLDYTQTDRNIANTSEQLQIAKAKDPNSKETRTLENQLETLQQSKKTAPDKAAEVVRRRVDPTGTKGIPVTTLGTDKQRLRIQLPKATTAEVNRIKTAIATQGRLGFHIVTDDRSIIEKVGESKTTPKTYIDPKTGVEYEQKSIEHTTSIISSKTSEPIVIRRAPDMDGSHVALAQARPSQESIGNYEINVRFDPAGSAQFERLTRANIKNKMAIVLDGVVYSAPVIQDAISSDCRISGNFSEAEANKLASVLTAGSLPAEVKLDQEFTIGPSLGQEQIQSGMLATAIASAAVIAFMLIYYRFSGLIASFCTLMTVVVLLGAMGFFKATLTLPGIAGIVLTLGMSVDANVLILERLREELARGRPLKLAVSHGFDRAFLTILDCNLTTLISGIVLYYLGTGPVRGFAVSLSLGIVATLFCNLWLNWILTEWMVSREAIGSLKFMQFFKTPNIDFMGWRRFWMALTGGLAVLCLGLFLGFANDLYDVDFKGGTLIQFNFAQAKPQDSETVKRDVRDKVIPALANALTLDAKSYQAILDDAVKTGKKDTELRTELLSKVPNGDMVAKEAETNPKATEGLAAGLKGLIEEFEKTAQALKAHTEDMTAQSFGSPVEGSKFSSFTVTTGLQDPIVVGELRKQVEASFGADLEPEPIVASGKNILVRFKKPDLTQKEIQAMLAPELSKAAADTPDAVLKEALPKLTVEKVAMEGAYLTAMIGGLPEDPAIHAQVVDSVKPLRLKYEVGGPISRVNSFGSAVASEMKWQALGALVIANLLVWIYLWFRFEFSGAWGFGAIIALIHDVVIAAGSVVIAHFAGQKLGFSMSFNLNTVAALLTIVGFSVNDTIVVFDRIREVKTAHPTRQYEDIVNEAVNATLSRTILTSLTVLLADVMLLIFGGPTIRDLAFTLLVGFTVGTYSSIYIASPLMIWWYRRFGGGTVPAPTATQRPAKGDPLNAQV